MNGYKNVQELENRISNDQLFIWNRILDYFHFANLLFEWSLLTNVIFTLTHKQLLEIHWWYSSH